jgi:conjugal transfer/entry exclusion protein
MEGVMYRRVLLVSLMVGIVATPARAQFAVIDPANLAQAILIAERTWNHWDELRQQLETIQRMAQGLGRVDSYRIPTVPIGVHDPRRWEYGGPWLEGMNSGDQAGTSYDAITIPLQPPNAGLDRLAATARRAFERQYSTIEITDAVTRMGGHQTALIRAYYERLQRAVEALESDVLNRQPQFHEMTAVLDEIAAGELLGRRQDTASNQLLAHSLEQLLTRSKRLRDTEAATINMQLTTWRDADHVNRAFVAGSGDALRTWRQP